MPNTHEVIKLPSTTRQDGGFGSTNQQSITYISAAELEQEIHEDDEMFLCELTTTEHIIINDQDP
jgi:hypothetical protein